MWDLFVVLNCFWFKQMDLCYRRTTASFIVVIEALLSRFSNLDLSTTIKSIDEVIKGLIKSIWGVILNI